MRFAFVLLTALFFAAPALAKDIKHTEAGVSYNLPSDWKTKQDGGMVETSTPDDTYHVLFLGLPKANMEAAVKAIGKELEKVGLKEVKTEEPVEGEINGMKVFMISGTAKVEGVTMEIGALIAMPPKGANALLAIGMNAPGAKAHDAALELVFKSMQPLKK